MEQSLSKHFYLSIAIISMKKTCHYLWCTDKSKRRDVICKQGPEVGVVLILADAAVQARP